MLHATVRVELGEYTFHGREIESLRVTQAVGDHARCTLTFDRDPRSASRSVASLRLADLADAVVRVAFYQAPAGPGAEAGTAHLAFAGRVRDAQMTHLPNGIARFAVTAVGDSCVLAAHADRRYLREQTLAMLGASVAGELPSGAPRDYVQRGESAWALLAHAAAVEGVQLRAVWPRSPDDAPPPEPAELGAGFADVTHALTWGRDLLAFETVLRPTNPGGDTTPARKLARNRAISAAYADLAQGDDRMRWAGLASVVSTQPFSRACGAIPEI